MPKVDWLDRLTFREIEHINDSEKKDSNFLYFMIEFPRIHLDAMEYSVVYFEKVTYYGLDFFVLSANLGKLYYNFNLCKKKFFLLYVFF